MARIRWFAFLRRHGKKNVWDRFTAAHTPLYKVQERDMETRTGRKSKVFALGSVQDPSVF